MGQGYPPGRGDDKVKRTVLLALLLLLLAACGQPPAQAPPAVERPDAISLQETADALMRSAQAIEAAAKKEREREKATERAYHLQATRLAQVITATAQAVNLQVTAQAGQATATAQALQANSQATAQHIALMATATAEAMVMRQAQSQATATVQALEALQQAEVQRRKREAFAAEMRLWLWLIFMASVMVIVLLLLLRISERYLNTLINRQLLVESRAGTLLLQPHGTQMEVVVVTPAGQLQPPKVAEEGDEFTSELSRIPYYVGGELKGYLVKNPADAPERRLALRLLRQAMQQAGPRSNRLPGWRELGWSADTWSKAVNLLRPYLESQSGRGGGTYLVGEYPTLQELYLAVGERRAMLSPTLLEVE